MYIFCVPLYPQNVLEINISLLTRKLRDLIHSVLCRNPKPITLGRDRSRTFLSRGAPLRNGITDW